MRATGLMQVPNVGQGASDVPVFALQSFFRQGTLKIVENIHDLRAAGRSEAHARRMLESSIRELDRMGAATNEWIAEYIPAEYRTGWDRAFQSSLYATPAGLGAGLDYSNFAKLNREAIEQIAYSMQNNINAALLQVGRQVDDLYRSHALKMTAERMFTGETIRTSAQKLSSRLMAETGVPYFTDRAGRNWKLDNYATMVARTTTREATTMGTLARARAGGYHLIRLSEHYPTCELCAPLQGIVYSMDPKDQRYPTWLDDYCPVHPNCLHTISVYVERYDPNKEQTLKRAQGFSPGVDPRPPVERQAYNLIQKGNAKKNALRNQFAAYKARLGQEAGTIQSFSRAKNAGGARWQELQQKYRAAGTRQTGGPLGAPPKRIDPAAFRQVTREELEPHVIDLWSQKLAAAEIEATNRYIRTGNSFRLNEYLYTGQYADDLAAGNITKAMRQIDALSAVIQKSTIPVDMKVVRNVGDSALDYIGTKLQIPGQLSAIEPREAARALRGKVGQRYINDSFISTSFDPAQNVFQRHPVQMEILATKGQTGLVTQNWMESEVVFDKGSGLELVDAVVRDIGGRQRLVLILRLL